MGGREEKEREGRRKGGRGGGLGQGKSGEREGVEGGGEGKREGGRSGGREEWREGYLKPHPLSGLVVPECRPLQHEPPSLVVLPHVTLLGEITLAQHVMHNLVHQVRYHFGR